MTVTVRVLIPAKTAEATQVTQYTANGVTTIIDKFTATNYSATAATISVNLVTLAGSAGNANLIVKTKTLQPSETYTFPEIVGFALYFFGYSMWKGITLYLEDIYVKESYRKHGIGQALFNTVVEIAKREGVRRMDWQVLEWNTPAIAFYEKNKALLDGEWINGRLYF